MTSSRLWLWRNSNIIIYSDDVNMIYLWLLFLLLLITWTWLSLVCMWLKNIVRYGVWKAVKQSAMGLSFKESLIVSRRWPHLFPLQWQAKEALIVDGPFWILCPLLSEGTETAPSQDALSRWFSRRKESCRRGILEGDLCSRSKTTLSGLLGWPVWRHATAQTAVFPGG